MMIWLTKMSVAWLLAIVVMTIIGGLQSGRGASLSTWDGVLGIGLVVGLPMLLFAFVIALPLSLLVARNMSPFAGALLYPFLIAGAAWLISAPLPSGWKGAQQAIILFAFIMGTGCSLLNLFVPPSPASI
ncbi:hypothetical protein [Sphingomonas sp. ERG5]|uniref:hypothetical protein n=1 Tax=Sphingomonas sp. ERG5 TaxID=1381597 RepID=UPI001269C8A7|nr:hypothetical protein [Sphingomonas sp. ERG5]